MAGRRENSESKAERSRTQSLRALQARSQDFLGATFADSVAHGLANEACHLPWSGRGIRSAGRRENSESKAERSRTQSLRALQARSQDS